MFSDNPSPSIYIDLLVCTCTYVPCINSCSLSLSRAEDVADRIIDLRYVRKWFCAAKFVYSGRDWLPIRYIATDLYFQGGVAYISMLHSILERYTLHSQIYCMSSSLAPALKCVFSLGTVDLCLPPHSTPTTLTSSLAPKTALVGGALGGWEGLGSGLEWLIYIHTYIYTMLLMLLWCCWCCCSATVESTNLH